MIEHPEFCAVIALGVLVGCPLGFVELGPVEYIASTVAGNIPVPFDYNRESPLRAFSS